ncbi:MAG: 3-methyl-2-oxobutanoate hydroxymethyltransferase [Anaerolineales bacterium]|nr:3-methyl-2-oxobutanoate hydroxymethyltransferase [Anaerolineales bacterium]
MRTTLYDIQKMKAERTPIPVLTAYDATTARIAETAGIPLILVGDSLGMVVQGNETPISVTLEEMIYHGRVVVRTTKKPLIVVDLPFMTYKISAEQALASAARVMQETGAGGVKLEGGLEVAPTVYRIVQSGIPVIAHVGLTPQSYHQQGGWRVQGREATAANALLEAAKALEAAGAFAIVLEMIPITVAKVISETLHIPTIGIGAGMHTDGQVQVFHDLVGLSERTPKHAQHFGEAGEVMVRALRGYAEAVQGRTFPTEANAAELSDAAKQAFEDSLNG